MSTTAKNETKDQDEQTTQQLCPAHHAETGGTCEHWGHAPENCPLWLDMLLLIRPKTITPDSLRSLSLYTHSTGPVPAETDGETPKLGDTHSPVNMLERPAAK